MTPEEISSVSYKWIKWINETQPGIWMRPLDAYKEQGPVDHLKSEVNQFRTVAYTQELEIRDLKAKIAVMKHSAAEKSKREQDEEVDDIFTNPDFLEIV
jgi:hypothetical protein